MVDPELRVTHVNEPMEKLTGYSRSEVVGRMTCGAHAQHRAMQYGRLCVEAGHGTEKAPHRFAAGVRDRQGQEIQVTIARVHHHRPLGQGHRRV